MVERFKYKIFKFKFYQFKNTLFDLVNKQKKGKKENMFIIDIKAFPTMTSFVNVLSF